MKKVFISLCFLFSTIAYAQTENVDKQESIKQFVKGIVTCKLQQQEHLLVQDQSDDDSVSEDQADFAWNPYKRQRTSGRNEFFDDSSDFVLTSG